MTEVKPVAWLARRIDWPAGHWSAFKGSAPPSWANLADPLYTQAALDAVRAEERERLRMWLMEMHERDKARHNYWACAAVELFGRATPSGETTDRPTDCGP